mgnify:CR=1 FL=1
MLLHYSDGKTLFGEKTAEEIQRLVNARPEMTHLVWKEGWQDWEKAQEILPTLSIADAEETTPRTEATESPAEVVSKSKPQPVADRIPEAASDIPESRDQDNAAPNRTDHSFTKKKGIERRWYIPGAVVIVAIVIVLIIFLTGGNDSTDFTGIYHFESETTEATIEINEIDENRYRIAGTAFHLPGPALGASVGEVDLVAFLEGDILKSEQHHSGYFLMIFKDEDGIICEETGENPDFGIGISFSHRYHITTREELNAESEADAESSRKMESESDEEEFHETEPGLEPEISLDLGGSEVLGLSGSWSASSTLDGNEERYGIANIDDYDARTVWSEGEPGTGEGARLVFLPRVSDVGQIAGFRILNGHCRTRALWEDNARVRVMRVSSGGRDYSVELLDTPDWQYVYLPECKVDGPIVFEVLSVYPGEQYDDLVISELGIMWELHYSE